MGDTLREANSSEVSSLREENDQLKGLVAELALKNRRLKKSMNGSGSGHIGDRHQGNTRKAPAKAAIG